jgi:prepilin-type processing-associated H-X9-DG protein
VHDDEKIVRINTELGQESFNVAFCDGSVFQFKPVLSVSPENTGEKELVLVKFWDGPVFATLGII